MALYQPGSSTRRKPLIRPALFTLLTIFSLLLAACGGDPSQPQENEPTAITILASPAGPFAAENFNPYLDNNSGSMHGTQGMIYETLVYMNRYTGEVTPMLASDYTLAEDAKSLSFTIRDGVKWSDGTAFTVEDVRYTFEDLIQKTEGFDSRGLWTTTIDSLNVEGNTITFNFKQANSVAVWDFAQTYIVPKHLWSKESNLSLQFKNSKPVGTGPYTIGEFSSEVYILKKNPTYWQPGKPAIDELRYIATRDNTAANLQIAQGKVDWAGIGWSPELDKDFVEKSPDKHHTWFPASNTVMLYLNLTNPMFSDLNVRKAISTALDREAFKAGPAPYAVMTHPSGLLPAQLDKYVSSKYKDAKFEQDQAAAEQFLKDAGYAKGGDGIYAKSGQKLSFEIIVPNGWTDWTGTVDLIVSQLKEIGIDAAANKTATPDIYTTALNSGDYEAAISWTNAGPNPFFFLRDWLSSTRTWEEGKPISGPTNWQHWQDAKTDELLNQYLTTADDAVQTEAIQGLTEIIIEQLPAIPLDHNAAWYEYTTTNATGWPSEEDPYTYGSPFNAPDNAQIVLNLEPVK